MLNQDQAERRPASFRKGPTTGLYYPNWVSNCTCFIFIGHILAPLMHAVRLLLHFEKSSIVCLPPTSFFSPSSFHPLAFLCGCGGFSQASCNSEGSFSGQWQTLSLFLAPPAV